MTTRTIRSTWTALLLAMALLALLIPNAVAHAGDAKTSSVNGRGAKYAIPVYAMGAVTGIYVPVETTFGGQDLIYLWSDGTTSVMNTVEQESDGISTYRQFVSADSRFRLLVGPGLQEEAELLLTILCEAGSFRKDPQPEHKEIPYTVPLSAEQPAHTPTISVSTYDSEKSTFDVKYGEWWWDKVTLSTAGNYPPSVSQYENGINSQLAVRSTTNVDVYNVDVQGQTITIKVVWLSKDGNGKQLFRFDVGLPDGWSIE